MATIITLDLDSTELNNDWLSSARLKDKKDKESKVEFKRRDETKMITLDELEAKLKTG